MDDVTVYKDEQFPELEFLDLALLKVDEYLKNKEVEILGSQKSFNEKKKELDKLKKRKEQFNKTKNNIKVATNEYKSVISNANIYELNKVSMIVQDITDKKIVAAFAHEKKKIEKRKIKAKKNLVKALAQKTLRDISLPLEFKMDDKKYELEYNPLNKKHETLGKMFDRMNVNPNELANQAIAKSEMESISKNNSTLDIREKFPEENMTELSALQLGDDKTRWINDPEYKALSERTLMAQKEKEQQDKEKMNIQQPMIEKIEGIVIKSEINQNQRRSLKVTKQKYEELSKLILESERIFKVSTIIREKTAFKKTNLLVNKYLSKLLTQQKEMVKITTERAKNDNLDKINDMKHPEEYAQMFEYEEEGKLSM